MNAPIESPGPATSSSSPLASSTSPSSSLVVLPTGPGARFEAGSRFIFVELFAGTGALTHAVGKYVSTLPPQDLDLGGVDFSDFAAVRRLWDTWKQLADVGFTFIFHVAPPCASFSRARDRSHRTRLRSSASPGGLYPYDPVTKKGNAIARNTAASVDFLVSLGGSGSWEQPAGSYMLPYLDSVEGLRSPREAVVLHQCLFGRPYRKPTAFWTFGSLRLPSLDRRCTPTSSCGRDVHAQLGFGHCSTAAAAAYPPKLVKTYVSDILTHIRCASTHPSSSSSSLAAVVVENAGVVHRHVDRGGFFNSGRAQRDEEDSRSRAGRLSMIVWLVGRPRRRVLLEQAFMLNLHIAMRPHGLGGFFVCFKASFPGDQTYCAFSSPTHPASNAWA